MHKVEIFPKNDGFLGDLLTYLKNKSSQFNRDFSIDNILNDNDSLQLKEYFIKKSPIYLNDVYGSTFQSSYRGNDQIYSISHIIKSIEVTEDKYFGNIDPWDHGEIIDFEQGFLKPVYFKKDDKIEYQIATFDIDFYIINTAA
jgi:hypothetical protein